MTRLPVLLQLAQVLGVVLGGLPGRPESGSWRWSAAPRVGLPTSVSPSDEEVEQLTRPRRGGAPGGGPLVSSVTGVDPAAVMLRFGRALTRPGRGHGSAVRYREGTAEALPLPDGSATVVWSLATVHHWRDLDAGRREVRRVLRPSGRFLAVER